MISLSISDAWQSRHSLMQVPVLPEGVAQTATEVSKAGQLSPHLPCQTKSIRCDVRSIVVLRTLHQQQCFKDQTVPVPALTKTAGQSETGKRGRRL